MSGEGEQDSIKNLSFFEKIFGNSKKKAPEVMMSRRCVQSLNQIEQQKSIEKP